MKYPLFLALLIFLSGCASTPQVISCSPQKSSNKNVVLFFLGDFCCDRVKDMKVVLAKLLPSLPAIDIQEINIDQGMEMAEVCGVLGVPALIRFESGVRKDILYGAKESAVKSFLEQFDRL